MKLIPHLAVISILSSWPNILFAMEDVKESQSPTLPHELMSACFQYLGVIDIVQAADVCRFWNQATNEDQLWHIIGKQNYKNIFKTAECSWKQAAQRAHLSQHFFGMSKWDKGKFEYVMYGGGYALFEKNLLADLGAMIIQKILPHQVDDKSALVAYFLAYHIIYINVAKAVAWSTASFPAYDPTEMKDPAWEASWNHATRMQPWFSHWLPSNPCEQTLYSAAETAERISWQKARETAINAIKNTAKAATKRAFEVLELDVKDADATGEVAYKLSFLCFYAYSFQDSYFTYFEQTFDEARKDLKKEKFAASAEEMLSVLAARTWLEPSVAQNPHSLLIKYLMTQLGFKDEDAQAQASDVESE